MSKEVKLKSCVVILLLLLSIFGFFYLQKINELNEITHELEQTRFELFNEQVNNGRYQMGLEILKERNSQGANQFIEIIENETE